ncbi:MAG TPA: hypothetical protein VMU95_38175 [Trebonia sp.]|nr:hypothetical protein [Trebonia sp.]
MRKKILTITAVASCATAAVLGQGSSAHATVMARSAAAHSARPAAGGAGPSATTTMTFAVTVGALSITAPTSATLGAGNPGTTIGPTPLGPVSVTDNRAALNAGWTVTAASTDFTTGGSTSPETIAASNVTYTPGPITTTGTVTSTPSTITLSGSPQTVVTATGIVGDDTASWNPNMSVAVPANAVGGTYTATLTHSVS